MPVTKKELRQLIKSGRAAIEYRMLGVAIRPRALTQTDDAELRALRALLKKYDELMSAHELPNIPDTVAANDNEGAKE
jgi:cytosine/adenosine deaminase-related metal-dependent hydrolase